MSGPRRSRLARLVLAGLFAIALVGVTGSSPGARVAAASRWTGGVDLYRSGVFTTQKTWLWCTAADVQIMRNIVDHRADHTRSGQQHAFDYMRAHNRYSIPVSDGVDPAGWTAGLRHYIDRRYRLVASGSFDSALRASVTNLRKTNLPVGITVSHGNHAWILTGFTATADPATTTRFTVTSVRVVGPLWGLQSRTYGYDMRPDRKLTPNQLKGFFTPWHYARVKMAWEGRWVSVQPVPAASAGSTATAKPIAAPSAKPAPVSTPAATPAPTPAGTPDPTTSPTIQPGTTSHASPVAVAALLEPLGAVPAGSAPVRLALDEPVADASTVILPAGLLLIVVAMLAVVSGSAWRARSRR